MKHTNASIILGKDGFAIPLDAITNTFGIFGVRGSGKSNCATVFAENIVKAGQPICIIDPTGSWFGMKSSRDGKSPGLPIYVFGGEHADVPLEFTAGAVLAEFMVKARVPLILDLKLMRKHEQVRFVMDFSETLYHSNREPLMVIVDECSRFAPQITPANQPNIARCLGAITDIVTLGRTRGLGAITLAQRPALINTTLRSQVENLICLRTLGKHDRKALDEWVEAKGTTEQRNTMLSDLASLPDGVGYFWSPSWLKEFRKISFVRRETFDSGATPKIGQQLIEPRAFAEIDKAKLTAQIQATVERVKADDPKELRKQIVELKSQLAKPTITSVIDNATIERRIQTAIAEVQKTYDATLTSAAKKVLAASTQLQNVFTGAIEILNSALTDFKLPTTISKPVITVPPAKSVRYEESLKQAWGTGKKSAPRNGSSSDGLSGGKRRILTVLAQRPDISARQVGLRAGLSSKSGTFGTYMSYLRANGFIGR